MKVRFYGIPSHSKSNLVCIYASVSYKSRRIFINSHITIEKRHFDPKKQKVKSSHPNCIILNRKLYEIETKIYEVFHSQPLQQDPSVTLRKIKDFFEIENQITLLELLDRYIEAKKMTASHNYIRSYYPVRSFIEKFARNIRPLDLTAKTIDYWTKILLEQNCSNVTIKAYFARLRVVLYWSFNRYIPKIDLSFLSFKGVENETTFSLTFDEIKALMHYTPDNHYQKVLDAFLFSCFTGLRFSDVVSFDKACIHNGIIEIRQKKTKRQAKIILLDPAKKILDKYTEQKPFQDLNPVLSIKVLRKIAKQVNLDRPVKIFKYKGGLRIDDTRPVYELITFHTGRRSFVTLLASLNVNPELIKAMTGHATQQEYERYHLFSSEHIKGLTDKLSQILN